MSALSPAVAAAPPETSNRQVDRRCCLLLAAFSGVYLWLWPRDLYLFDEGMILYEARRLSEGAVLYRDIFQIVTPGFFYLVAGAFTVFGATMAVARTLMALIHIGIQCLIFLVARRLGARPLVALLAAVAELAVVYSALPQANPHWMSTLAGMVMLLALLRVDTGRAAFWLGVGSGACVLVQQHRGSALTAAVAAVLLLDAWSAAAGWGGFVRQVLSRWSRFALGALGMVALGMAPLLIAAGPPAVYEGLVRFPLTNYRQHHSGMVWWGMAFPPFMRIAAVVTWLPALIPLALLRGAAGLWRRQPPATWRPLLVTGIVAATTTAMMWYFPDFVHLAIAAPASLALAAEGVERLTAVSGRRRWRAAVLAPLAAGIAWLLVDNLATRQAWYQHRRSTAFGEVDFPSGSEAAAMEIIARGLDQAPRRETFAYPYGASLYLVAGAVNPTRFQFLNPSYSDPAQVDEVIRILEQRQVPYVFVSAFSIDFTNDRVVKYLKQAYRRVPLPAAGEDRWLYAVFKRKPGAAIELPPLPISPPPMPKDDTEDRR